MNAILTSSRGRCWAVTAHVAAAVLAGCGGGDSTPTGTADALSANKPVVIQSYGENVVSAWNEIAFKTASVPPSPAGATPQERVPGPDVVTVQLAVYDAVIAIAGTHRPYAITPRMLATGAGEVAMQAAAIEAAYRVLKGLFPSRGINYEDAYTTGMGAVSDGDAKTTGRLIGAEVAAGMLALRANDGRETVLPPYTPGTLPGEFRGTNPVNRIGPYILPFTTNSHSQFRAPPPNALDSAAYAADFNEVKALATKAGPPLSAAQQDIARFHTEPPGGFWARNLRQFATASPNLAENARLLAMLWTAQADAGSACFESKYYYKRWRPTSAIRLADTDGNSATEVDVTWEPWLATPNHPEYPAAHGCASASVMEVVRSVYGTKNVVFDFTSTVTGTTHHFERTDDLLHEVRDARVWGGMHFRTSIEIGTEQGKDVAKWLTKNHFLPVN